MDIRHNSSGTGDARDRRARASANDDRRSTRHESEHFLNWLDLAPYVTGSAQPKLTPFGGAFSIRVTAARKARRCPQSRTCESSLFVALISGVLFGIIPVFKYAGPGVAIPLRGGGRTSSQTGDRRRTRDMLVVVQVALAVILPLLIR